MGLRTARADAGNRVVEMTAVTLCKYCDHPEPDSTKGHPRFWLCTQHPRIFDGGFVTDEVWDKHPPYLYCISVNGGACQLYKHKEISDANRE
jgi:uncharacterized Zn-finger protein